jgi:hypothetical protein
MLKTYCDCDIAYHNMLFVNLHILIVGSMYEGPVSDMHGL